MQCARLQPYQMYEGGTFINHHLAFLLLQVFAFMARVQLFLFNRCSSWKAFFASLIVSLAPLPPHLFVPPILLSSPFVYTTLLSWQPGDFPVNSFLIVCIKGTLFALSVLLSHAGLGLYWGFTVGLLIGFFGDAFCPKKGDENEESTDAWKHVGGQGQESRKKTWEIETREQEWRWQRVVGERKKRVVGAIATAATAGFWLV